MAISVELILGIAVATVVAVLISRLLITQRSNKQLNDSPKDKPRPRDFTFRVDEIPAGTSRSVLETNLRTLQATALPILKDALGTLEIRSLATRDAHFACATATITTPLSEADLFRSLHKALRAVGLPYRCDCNFLGITPLYDSEASADACDVIAVPGLASHAVGSWKTPGENEVWLRDWLPKDIPNVRVLLYGYDTTLLKNESTSSIEDLSRRLLESVTTFRLSTNVCAAYSPRSINQADETEQTQSRPVIFIGHSLGGLLVKEALVQAYRSPDSKPIHKPLYKNCCGIIFFGVPHLGLRNEALKTLVEGQPNQALVDSIVVDNESEPSHFLARISDDFARCFHGETRVVSFYERKRSPTVEMHNGKLSKTGAKVLMVTRKSATSTGITGVSEEDNIPLEEDHSGLVKFQSRGQDAYSVVRERIRSFVSKAASVDNYEGKDTNAYG
ncbi:ankyrin repeat domain-containing protein [Colletotrichum karsti]|uniref:Ankyrin repeat domain-containing protein n=1 Tax=Colletotrichum karsti TaxID=1095194 RepID=A0A9P6HZE3_9PEZI|nr:ankyrin repeat domain-containing protein [Colletotrichum karsti]KAF9872960.1 ankyrin repeat domain-containing protein [Colletotrichum karsti]